MCVDGYNGQYHCRCREGHVLQQDGKACIGKSAATGGTKDSNPAAFRLCEHKWVNSSNSVFLILW